MKKNLIIIAVTVLSVFAFESAVYFGYWCNNLHKKYVRVRKQNIELRAEIENYKEILDSIDNPHHHAYLQTIGGYQKLHPFRIESSYRCLQAVR